MATLKFWTAIQYDDRPCYNPVAKTKKEILSITEKNPHIMYEEINHIQIDYKDAFDLFNIVTGEGGGRDGSYKVLSRSKVKNPLDEES